MTFERLPRFMRVSVMVTLADLASFLQNSLKYYVDAAEEQQMLSGDGTAENLHGILPQASAFNASSLVPSKGWNFIDIVGRAVEQITAAKELQPTFVALHPNDWWSMRLQKDSLGRYILGDPQQPSPTMNLFGLDVVATTNIAPFTFLIGSGNSAAIEIRDRLELVFEISTEHLDYFAKNLVACRAEKRLALIVRRPGSFLTGTFSTSP